MAGAVGPAVSRWRGEARALGLTQAAIDRMASTFEHADLEQAVRFNAASYQLFRILSNSKYYVPHYPKV